MRRGPAAARERALPDARRGATRDRPRGCKLQLRRALSHFDSCLHTGRRDKKAKHPGKLCVVAAN
eukprot:11159795-Lingulodinium_polyedra.AAC.1